MSKILITGASGFIGSHLIEYLLEDGEKLKNLRLLIPQWESLNNIPERKFEIIVGDIRNLNTVTQAMKGVDIVYHLAAKTIINQGTYDYYKDVNVNGTKNLIAAAKKEKIKKFINFSSISVYGLPAWKGDMENVNEKWPKEPSEPYGQSKLVAENLVISAGKKWGLKYIIIRPTTVYGPRDKAGINQLFKALRKHLFFYVGNGENKMDYVYVKDLVRAARLAQKSNIEQEDFIIGAGKPSTQKKIVTAAAKSLDIDTNFIHIPKIVSLPLSYIIKYVSGFLGIHPLLFPDRIKVLTSNCFFDISKAKRLLRYKQEIGLLTGMVLTAKDLSSNE